MLSYFVIFASLHLSLALFGGMGMSSEDRTMHLRKIGFEEDPKTFSHELVVPWARSFKPGYCSSWEWHTDKDFRNDRIKVCKDISGAKQHECDSPDGFCHDKCPFKNGSYPFWRLRNADTVPFLWTIKTLQMFENPSSRFPLTKDPTKGYASTFFGPGYYPSNAFDNNVESLWVSNGVSTPGLNWIAYAFDHPVQINSIKLVGEADHTDRTPEKIAVEASCEKYFRTFTEKWVIENPTHQTDKRFHKPMNRRN